MAKRPENRKYVPASALAPRATMMIAKGLENRAYNKQNKAKPTKNGLLVWVRQLVVGVEQMCRPRPQRLQEEGDNSNA